MRTFASLRHRNYRLFFAGQLVSLIGTWLQSVAQSWLVLQLTNSALALGLVGAAAGAPLLVLSPVGGVVADRLDKHRLIVGTQVSFMVLALALATLTSLHLVRAWHVMIFAAVTGTVTAVDMPARQAFVVEMVGPRDLMNAIALNSTLFNAARVLGPALAGLLVVAVGVAGCFYLNGASTRLLAPASVRDVLEAHFLNGDIYPKFLERPPQYPALRLTVVEPYRAEEVDGYTVLPVPVNHAIPATGYHVTGADGKSLFYTGDTGAGLTGCWEQVSPQLLIIEATMPGRYGSDAVRTGHLTPPALAGELAAFREKKGYLPRVLLVHTNPYLETEIAADAAQAAKELGIPLAIASEGMTLEI